MSTPSAGGIGTGAYTVAILFMPNLFGGEQMIWKAYEPSNFSHRGLYVNGDMWMINEQAETNIVSFGNPQQWYWFVATKSAANEAPRAHWAIYEETGPLLWSHIDAISSQSNANLINRLCLGDEFGDEFKGTVACLTAFETEMDDAQIGALFTRNSLDIMDASPDFFVHWPEADGIVSSFEDLGGGGLETIRTGSWANVVDPPGFDFSLERSGKPKIWTGTDWVQYPVKTFQDDAWVLNKILGHDGIQWVTSK